jgi:hypothetical protein
MCCRVGCIVLRSSLGRSRPGVIASDGSAPNQAEVVIAMRFMIIRKADKDTEAGVMPSEALLSAMGRYNEEMIKAGVMLAGEGLQPSSKGARIKFSGGVPTIIDGPFTETKELIAGFTIIEVGSKEEALAWVRRWPALDGGGEVELELRQVFELSDFAMDPAEEPDGWRQREQEFRERQGRPEGS